MRKMNEFCIMRSVSTRRRGHRQMERRGPHKKRKKIDKWKRKLVSNRWRSVAFQVQMSPRKMSSTPTHAMIMTPSINRQTDSDKEKHLITRVEWR